MDVKIGSYWPSDSVIHRLDARVKILSLIVLLVVLLKVRDPLSLFLYTVLSGILIVIAKIPFKIVLKSFKNVTFLVIFAFFMNLLFRPGSEQVLWSWGALRITKEGLAAAFLMSYRILLLIFNSTFFLSLTTKARALSDAMEKLLQPLKYLKVPVSELAMMMSIALRFIPTLIDESDRIIKAQASRGGDLDQGGFLKKARAFVVILVPLFVTALRRAEELAIAMEARCYQGGDNRTQLNEPHLVWGDWLFFGIITVIGLFILWV